MYKTYLIITIVGSAVFTAAYIPANNARKAEADRRVAALIAEANEEEAKRKADEEAARAADRERREAREREELEREEKKEAEENAKNAELRASIEETNAKADGLAADLEKRRKDLESARQARLKLQEQVFEGKKANELARIQLRNAQFEAQRALDFVASKANANPALLLPPPPPVAPPKK